MLEALLLALVAAMLPAQGAQAATVDLDLEPGRPLVHPSPIGVVNLYWDAHWDPSEMSSIDNAMRAVIASDYAVKTAQYGVHGFSWAGRGQVLGVCPFSSPPQTVGMLAIILFLTCEESLGGVPPALGQPGVPPPGSFGTASTIYNVIVPSDRTVELPDGTRSCTGQGAFGGFHYAWPSYARLLPPLPPGRPIVFTVIIKCPGPNSASDYLPVISHELIEAATNPLPLPPSFWIDLSSTPDGNRSNPANWGRPLLSKGEAADICGALYEGGRPDWLAAQGSFKAVSYAGTKVAAFWSNADDACVVGPSRVVYTTFQPFTPSLNTTLPVGVSIGGVAATPWPFAGALLEGTSYEFTFPDPGPQRRYRYHGECSGTVTFPEGNVNATASRSYACAATRQDLVQFVATGLDGRAWQVIVDGATLDGPASTFVDEGSLAELEFTFAPVAGCTLTGTSLPSPLVNVTEPVTVTATYDCPPPPPPPPPTGGFVIDSTRDAVDAVPGDGVCATADGGDCSLRAAVMEANALSGPDTIDLPAGTYTLSIPGTTPEPRDTAADGDLEVEGNLTIVGAGASNTIVDGGGIGRIFQNNDTLRMSGVTLRGGRVAGTTNRNGGGGAISNLAELFLDDAVVEGNSATFGGGIENESDATLTDVIIRDNTVPLTGFWFGDIGGGIYNGADLVLRRVTIEGNSAPNGAGFGNESTAWIYQSTLSANVATDRGGGVFNEATLTIENSTISGNSAEVAGGGIYQSGTLSVTASTVASNAAPAGGGLMVYANVTLATTIDWGNVGGDCGFRDDSFRHTIFSSAPNLVGDLSCGIGGLEGVDPLLGPLQQNGGGTETRALAPGSPAIDAGGSVCPATDQRDVPRPQGPFCDIGAYERQ